MKLGRTETKQARVAIMTAKTATNQTRRRGSTMVEFALVASALFLLMAGAGDFARVFFHAITVANASSTGAFQGTYNNIQVAMTGHRETIAVDDARNIGSGVVAESTMFCECTNGNSTPCLNPQCGNNGPMRLYSRTVVEQSFETFLPWPGIPTNVFVNRETTYRVQ